MKKRLQNRVAESRWALAVTAAYAVAVWLAAGLVAGQWWVQFACFVVSTYLMVELNNGNALIRIYSRMVSCSFVVLSCMVGLFAPMGGAIAQLCLIASYLTLFNTYQDKQSAGWTFYSFLLLSLASMAQVHVLFYVPVVWLLMAFNLLSMSWRTLGASLLGLLTPYWFAMTYLLFRQDFTPLLNHFAPLLQFGAPFSLLSFSEHQLVTLAFIVVAAFTGIIHYLRTSFHDKMRIRQLYSIFITVDLVTLLFLLAQPQHYDLLMRILVVNTSPLFAHFLSLTRTRITNLAFIAFTVLALLITAYNLWMPSFIF